MTSPGWKSYLETPVGVGGPAHRGHYGGVVAIPAASPQTTGVRLVATLKSFDLTAAVLALGFAVFSVVGASFAATDTSACFAGRDRFDPRFSLRRARPGRAAISLVPCT